MPGSIDNSPVNTVYFDLDGTLADTAPDLASSLNALRAEHGLPALPFEQIRPVVSHGGNALIQLAFNQTPDDPGFAALRERFLQIYNDRLHADSQLFEGMEQVLESLEKKGIQWGIITNKPLWLTTPLLEKMHLQERAACVVCGDSTTHRKPHPAPMLLALQLTGSSAGKSVYIGDHKRDIEAGRAVNMKTLVALYGYLSANDQPGEWQADGMINSPDEILEWLEKQNNQS